MKCSLTVCSSTERKEKERNVGVGHNLIYGKDIVFAWEIPGKEEKKKKEGKGELDQDEDAAEGAWTVSSC